MDKIYRWFYEKFGWRKEQVDQTLYVVEILGTLLLLLVVVAYAIPGTRPLMIWFISGVGKLFVFVVEGLVVMLFGSAILAHHIRKLVDYGDEKRAESIDLASWIH